MGNFAENLNLSNRVRPPLLNHMNKTPKALSLPKNMSYLLLCAIPSFVIVTK